MTVETLHDLACLPISTSQIDLRDRISDVFSLIERGAEGTSKDFAQAFIDVITYQSYAGEIPKVSEYKVLDWINSIYNEFEPGLIEILSDLYLCMSTARAYSELKSRLDCAQSSDAKRFFKSALEEFEQSE